MNKAEEWKRHVRSQLASGMSQRKYCARNGLNPVSFNYWHKRLGKKAQAAEGGFVTVSTGASAIELVIGEVIIRVNPGSDLLELRRVVEALS